MLWVLSAYARSRDVLDQCDYQRLRATHSTVATQQTGFVHFLYQPTGTYQLADNALFALLIAKSRPEAEDVIATLGRNLLADDT